MTEIRVRATVPVLQPYNSLYIQASLWISAIKNRAICDPDITASSAIRPREPGWLTLYHYGSFDWFAFSLARQESSVFVFHNVTDSKYLWRWRPLAAIRSIAAGLQLKLLPKTLPWLAVSTFNRDVLMRKGFKNVSVVPCIVPEGQHWPKSKQPTLLFVGRISPNKNVLELLEAYAMARATVAGDSPLLIIVGTRKTRCRYGDAFERRFAKLGKICSIVWHREPLSYTDLQKLYSTSWIYITASRHEGFAVPVMESIRAGTPALYLPCGGTEKQLNGVGCVKTVADLASAIRSQIANADLREQLLERQIKLTAELEGNAVATKLIGALERFA